MKLKYYLRGIGIGILVTTLILMITSAIHRDPILSDAEIMERAEQLGMVMPQKLQESNKLAGGDEAASSQNGEDGQNFSVQEQKTSEPGQTTAVDEQAAESPEKEEVVIEQVEITIVGGEYSDDVCKKLKKAGVIQDADDFNKYLAEGGYDNLIQPGNYLIPLDADYDFIVKLITEKKR